MIDLRATAAMLVDCRARADERRARASVLEAICEVDVQGGSGRGQSYVTQKVRLSEFSFQSRLSVGICSIRRSLSCGRTSGRIAESDVGRVFKDLHGSKLMIKYN